MTPRVQALIAATTNESVTARYWAKIVRNETCWQWTGAVSGKGHGRFWIGDGLVVVAHRFGWLLNAGDGATELPEVVSHDCDNPLCQNPAHLRAGTWSSNRREYVQRVGTPTSPLRDTRGSRGRALALREAARSRTSIKAAVDAGLGELDRYQATLW
jgi:hypothetical protein